MWALVIDGRVHELTDVDPDGRFHPDMGWVNCAATPGVAVGWSYDGSAFSAPPPPPPLSLAQQAQTMLATGMPLVSSGTTGLSATYRCDLGAQVDVQAEMISLLVNGAFTNGLASIPWPDATGAVHGMSIAQFKAMATAMGAYVGTLKVIAASDAGTLPTLPVTIA